MNEKTQADKACDAYFDSPYSAMSGSYYADRVGFYAGFAAGAASRDAEIAELVAALERMRVAGGSQEFHIAWELAKDVLDKVRKP